MIYKEHIHARLIALPSLPELYKTTLPNCYDIGQFMCINGTVIRASAPKMIEYRKTWRCSKCKHQFVIDACVEKGYICEKPLACPNPEWCNGKNFICMNTDISTKFCKD
ncbi:DNA replication licensing factor MCM9, partial [Stegodyphus mimosarum]